MKPAFQEPFNKLPYPDLKRSLNVVKSYFKRFKTYELRLNYVLTTCELRVNYVLPYTLKGPWYEPGNTRRPLGCKAKKEATRYGQPLDINR
jgi:hypothetical protein